MRICSDGFVDCSSGDKVRTPGKHDERIEPLPEREALSFLLSHAFLGPRRIVRRLTVRERSALRHAMWTESVGERMSIVDRIWRGITEPETPLREGEPPHLVQVVVYGKKWAYPLYLNNNTMRVLPQGGLPLRDLEKAAGEAPRIDLRTPEKAA